MWHTRSTGWSSGCCTQPTVRVRQLATSPGGDQYAALVRELFDLAVPGADEDVSRAMAVRSDAPPQPRRDFEQLNPVDLFGSTATESTATESTATQQQQEVR